MCNAILKFAGFWSTCTQIGYLECTCYIVYLYTNKAQIKRILWQLQQTNCQEVKTKLFFVIIEHIIRRHMIKTNTITFHMYIRCIFVIKMNCKTFVYKWFPRLYLIAHSFDVCYIKPEYYYDVSDIGYNLVQLNESLLPIGCRHTWVFILTQFKNMVFSY